MKQLQASGTGLDPAAAADRRAERCWRSSRRSSGISRVATEPSLAMLYSGLDSAAAGEVVAELEAEGIAFEVDGTSIMVDQRGARPHPHGARRQGAAGGRAGRTTRSSTTSRASAPPARCSTPPTGAPRRASSPAPSPARPNVRAARVHLANPVSQPFSRTPAGSASVTVTMARGELDRGQAEAIRYLVSSAVAGVAPEAVAVMDAAKGVVLAGKDDRAERRRPSSPNARAETLRSNVQRLLEARVGPGQAIVEVNVDADMDSQTITERTIDPQSQVAISSETEESAQNAAGRTRVVTVASNLPDGDVGGNKSGTRATSTSQPRAAELRGLRDQARAGRSSRVRCARSPSRSWSTASRRQGADGKDAWAPRPPEEMETLRQLVQSAIGFDAARGDTVTIESLEFTPPPGAGHAGRAAGVAVPRHSNT